MLPLLMLFLTQDPSCERITSGKAFVLARLIGTKADCENCLETDVDYKVEESFSARIPVGRIRLKSTSTPTSAGGIHLVEIALHQGQPDYVASSEPIEGNPDDHPLVQRLRDKPPATLPVEVLQDGRPLGDAQVTLSRSGSEPVSVVTDATGIVRFPDLPAGTYELRVGHDLYNEERQTIQIPAGSCSVLRVDLRPLNQFDGLLTDDSGNPLVNVEMGLIDEPTTEDGAFAPRGVSMTGEDGRFHFENVPVGRYVLAVNGMGSATGLVLPTTFYPDLPSMAKAVRFDIQPGSANKEIRFVLKNLGRRYDVEVKGIGPDGKEELWHFLQFSGGWKGADAASKCCSSWPQLRFIEEADGRKRFVSREPTRHKITLFEKMTYTIDPQEIRRGSPGEDSCLASLPVTLDEGPKKDVVLRFQKVACGR